MKLTKKQRQELYLKYDKKCAYCGSDLPIKGWHADHSFAILRHHYYDNLRMMNENHNIKTN